jgi:hypothetical protein
MGKLFLHTLALAHVPQISKLQTIAQLSKSLRFSFERMRSCSRIAY